MFRRLLLLTAALLSLCLPSLGEARKGASLAHVRVVACERGDTPAERRAVFRASMRAIPGTERMWMRFSVQESAAGGPWRTVRAPGLGGWRISRAGVGRFVVRQRVLELGEGASYRLVARLRWYDEDGHLLGRGHRRSGQCHQAA